MITDKEIAQKAIDRYGDDMYLFAKQRDGYEEGWKECTEHYRELIEAGVKWKELYQTMDSLNKDKEVGDCWRDEEVMLIGENALKIANIIV